MYFFCEYTIRTGGDKNNWKIIELNDFKCNIFDCEILIRMGTDNI